VNARDYWASVLSNPREECWSRKHWRRERNWDPTFSEFVGRQLARGSDTEIQLPRTRENFIRSIIGGLRPHRSSPLPIQNKLPVCFLEGATAEQEAPTREPVEMSKLTNRLVEAAEVRDRDYFIWDEDLPGFGLRVFPSGRKRYVVQYRAGRRSRRLNLGPSGVLTCEQARNRALTIVCRSHQERR
jgi:hypothetical protein